MVQIPPDTMEALRQALRDQADFQIPCGRADSGEVRETVHVRWVDWTPPVNAGYAHTPEPSASGACRFGPVACTTSIPSADMQRCNQSKKRAFVLLAS